MELQTDPEGNLTGIKLDKFEQDILGFFSYLEIARPAKMAPQIADWAASSLARRKEWVENSSTSNSSSDALDHHIKAISALESICADLVEFIEVDTSASNSIGYHGENC